jgi:Alr-MurF fusion protein
LNTLALCPLNEGDQKVIQNLNAAVIQHIVIDSRDIFNPAQSLFFALKGNLSDGHNFIENVINQGVRNFIVSDDSYMKKYKDVNYIVTKDVTRFLQQFVTQHRQQFTLPVVGITGSNGKTVIKEWLSILLSKKYNIAKTPKSFNSQIGVPISVAQLNEDHSLGIFEAGISTSGEMEKLQAIIQPTLGIFTNIGDAHQSGFNSLEEKITEKLKLFSQVEAIVFNGDNELISSKIKSELPSIKLLAWGHKPHHYIHIIEAIQVDQSFKLVIQHQGAMSTLVFNLENQYYFENFMHCLTLGLYLGLTIEEIESSIPYFDSIDMRLKIIEGKDDSLIINDAYTNDYEALNIAIGLLKKQAGQRRKILILSEFDSNEESIYQKVAANFSELDDALIILIGKKWQQYQAFGKYLHFDTTEDFIPHAEQYNWAQAIILLKGSRKFAFEKIDQLLQRQSHSVSLDIDMAALAHNISVFSSLLKSGTMLFPIIKASAYGSGAEEIARLLQYKGIQKLGVAFADEAVQLRNKGITIPIAVLNADPESFYTICEYQLELEVYSLDHLQRFIAWNDGKMIPRCKVHIKLDTGMSRLGFQEQDITALCQILTKTPIQVATIFSHLSSSEDAEDNNFSHRQANRFMKMYEGICEVLPYRPMRHLLNSSGIIRFPECHFEMVRLGLGMYGIDPTGDLQNKLEKVHTLKAKIIQIKNLMPGDYVGYNRRHKVEQPMKIGILNIGYADGFMRKSGNSRHHVLVNGHLAPVVGNVCMDLSMIDLTDINAQVEDTVILFGKELAIEDLSKINDTIPYEILCRIAPRIKRNYLE